MYGNIISYEQNDNQITIYFEKQKVILQIIREDIVRVLVPYWMEDYQSAAIEEDKSVPCTYTVEEYENMITVKTGKLTIKLEDDGYMDVYDGSGKLLMSDYRGIRTLGGEVNDEANALLAAEGHVMENMAYNYPVQTVKALDTTDCFYGLGDKTGFINKRGYEYENWNSDLPQAHTESFPALYKSIPFLICKKKNAVFGLFFDNSFRSIFNLGKESEDYFFYGAEGGNLDCYIIGGNTMVEVVSGYTYLTGTTPLPQRWTLGLQQSRWGYESASDLLEVARGYRNHRIPCDAIHLDIDYMQGFRVFTWNEKQYGPIERLTGDLKSLGFKPVCIIDPGTKYEKEYFMYEEGVLGDYFVKDAEGKLYVNAVWPGDANFPDFGRSEVREWWASHHEGLLSNGIMGIWNDMNEPASFHGELPEDVQMHFEERQTTHEEMHNLYGHFMAKATYEGIKEISGRRPFVITRACYAGTQKYSTVWTGDNQSLWSHLQMMIPQLCNLGLSGFAFCGADVGGFGADCTKELMCRWIEAACFSPLFRNHSARGTKRQEPWQFGEECVDITRKYVELRYRFLPYIYDLFYQGTKTGLPVMRPLVLHYEDDPEVQNMNGEFLVGENILVAPVVVEGENKKIVYLPEGVWYDYWTGECFQGRQYIMKDAPLETLPIYIKAGSIIPTYDPVQYIGQRTYTTLRLLTTPGVASWNHYLDNGKDFRYKDGKYNLYHFEKDMAGNITTTMLHENFPGYLSIMVDPLLAK